MRPEKTTLKESLDRISKLGTDPDEFKIWLKSFLISKISDPLPGYSLRVYPHEYLYKIYESTENVRFQERLRRAVKELFKDWNINATRTETIEYYSSLLNLIAELPVSEVYPDLIEIALSGSYCGILTKNEKLDVQTLILQVIAGFPASGIKKLKERLMDLVKKYIHDNNYTPLCFRIAWQIQYENAIQYIKPLLECAQIRYFDIYGTIERFLLGCGVGKFKDLLIPMLQELKLSNMREYFLKILLELGVEISISKFRFVYNFLSLRWKLDDQPESKGVIFCEDGEIITSIEKVKPIDVGEEKNKDEEFLEGLKDFLYIDAPPSYRGLSYSRI